MGMSEHRMNVYRLPQAPRIEEPDPLPLVRVPRRPEIAPPRFGIGSIFRIFRLRRWTILSVVVVCTAAVAIILSQLTPLYTASALVVVGQKRTDTRAVVDPLATDAAAETQLRVLQSTWLAERVIAALNLARDPEFTRDFNSPIDSLNPLVWFAAAGPKIGAAQGQSAIDPAVMNRFAARLSVGADGGSSVARVTFTSTNPVKAALIANTIVAAYLQTQTNVANAGPATADEELVRLTQRVRETEAAIESRKAQPAAAEVKGAGTLADDQLTELNGQIAVARQNLADQERKHRRAVSLLSSGDDPAAIASVTSAPQIIKLRDKQADLTRRETELSEKYGDRHPQMIAIRQERSELQAKIDDELKRIIKTLASAVTVAKTRVTSLETSLNEMQGAATTIAAPAPSEGGDQTALRDLENELATRRAALEQYRSTSQAPTGIPADGSRMAGKATAPSEPSFPDTPIIMGGTLFGSTLIGMLFALVMESMGKGFRAGHEIERMAHVPNLAVVPNLKGVKHVADLIMQKPSSAFTEAVRTLYTGLQLSNHGDRPPKVVVMTSSLPHEGKTSLAVSLGRLASKGGARVILIDADLRHPSVGAAFSPRRPEAGLVEVLTGQRKLRDVLHRDPISPLEFIPTAAPAQSPLELLACPAMKNMMDILRQHYDLVIIDAAPVLPVADTRFLSRIADKMIYVVGWDTTPREAVAAGLRLLHDANAEVAGTVLNQADTRRHAIYSHGSASYGYGTKYARYHAH